jgi:hypothetical protein
MKAYGGVDVWIHIFLTSALAVGEWSASRPCRFTTGERAPGTHWIGGPQSRSEQREEEIRDPTETRTRTPQSSSYPVPIPTTQPAPFLCGTDFY